MHHPPFNHGAPSGLPRSEPLYLNRSGQPVTLDTWNEAKLEHTIVRDCEALLLILAERVPYKTEPEHRARIQQLLGDTNMYRLLVAFRQLPERLRPAAMNRLQVLSFALKFSSRYMRAHATSG